MNDNQLFRIVLVVGFAIIFPISAYYRIRSQATREKLDRRQEGWFILLTLRPVAVISMAALLAYLINPQWMAWSALPLPAVVRWLGVVIGACAGGLLIWTLQSLGRNLTDTVVTRQQHSLVTSGPYRWVRHPFYSAFALAVIANGLVTANWFLFVAGAIGFALIVIRTDAEEQNLLARFGDEYRCYMESTGRFLPRWSRNTTAHR
jgi:protein-S-isoprenylcysteine O-methyltransferase Ste14